MNNKLLNEAAWKAWSKGRPLNDAPMAKLLATWGKLQEQDTDKQLETLSGIFKQTELLRGAHKSDKDVLRQMEVLAKEIKQQEQEARTRKAQASRQGPDDEADDTPTLLGAKLLAHFKVLKSTEGLRRPMVIGLLGQEAAVALAMGPPTPAHRKLLQARLGGGAVKFFVGECLFEMNAYTFVLDKSISGLAKKLSLALISQTEKKFKVRVRGSDPADVDEDIEDEAEQARTSGGGNTTPAAPEDLFKSRLAALAPAVKAAMAREGPVAEALKLKVSEAGTLARRRDFKAAQALLDQVDTLLKRAAGTQTEALQDRPGQVNTQATTTTQRKVDGTPPADLPAALKARLGALLPDLKAAVAQGGAPADQFKLLQSEIATLLRRDEAGQALPLIERLERLLKAADIGRPRADEVADTGARTRSNTEADGPSEPVPDDRAQAQLDRRLRTDAQQAYADYLDLQGTSGDLDQIEAQLRRTEARMAAWQEAAGRAAGADSRGQMDVLAGKIALERDSLTEVRQHAADMDDLLAQLADTQDPAEQAALHDLLQELMQSFPA